VLDPRNGNAASTWGFYLEGYTAGLAIQAGYVDDALALIENIGLVNLRLGLGWAQNLWNPGFLTYVTAPVTWFIPDVLAGAGLDVRTGTLLLAPTIKGTENLAVYPLYFPTFWATVVAKREVGGGGGGTVHFTVTRSFAAGGATTVIRQVLPQPVGVATAGATAIVLPAPFTCLEGAELDLSAHWGALTASTLRDAVLPSSPP
jgi:hypothetical protein